MKMSASTILMAMLICSLPSLAAAVESNPGRETKTPSLLQVSPQTALAPIMKSAEAAPAQQSLRLGYVDLARIAAESETGKAGQAQIAELKKKFQGQLETKRKQLEKQKSAIEAKLKTFSPEQRETKGKEFQKKVEEFQKFGMNAEKELQARQEEFSDKLFKAIEQASAELSKAKGLALVVIKRELLYLGSGVDAVDVTDGVITIIDGKEVKK